MTLDPTSYSQETLSVVVILLLLSYGPIIGAVTWLANQLIKCLKSNAEASATMTEAMRAMTAHIETVERQKDA